MTITLEDKWIWDSWYAHDGEVWHGYFLQAPKSIGDPDQRHWNVSIGHAVSNDLEHWEHLGTCFAPSAKSAWDDCTTWTGSVVRDDSGLWHLFYTGTSSGENGTCQRIGHAVSDDLHNWKRVGDGLCLDMTGSNAELYEHRLIEGFWHERAMRDPWVMRNLDGEGWFMYFTARVAGEDETNAAGAIGFATSADLNTWTLEPPVFSGGFGQLEVPQVFNSNERWYCLFCTLDKHFSLDQTSKIKGCPVSGTHYLIGESPTGPWSIAPGRFLDGRSPCKRYAARIVEHQDSLQLLGFMDNDESGKFGGYVMNPEAVSINRNGLLEFKNETGAQE